MGEGAENKVLNRDDILAEAGNAVRIGRNLMYGEPEDNFKIIADFWSVYLGHEVTSVDVANMMILFKVARTKGPAIHTDTYIDIAGYAACAGEVQCKMLENQE